MKSPYFLKNWRVYRALVCLAFAGGIVVAMLNHRDALERQTLTSISSHIMSSWSLSELFFETMRLSEQVQDFELGRGDRDAVALRFDIIWSRIETIRHSAIAQSPEMAEALSQMHETMQRVEQDLLQVDSLSPQQLEAARSQIMEAMLSIRRLFRANFISSPDAIRNTIVEEQQVLAPGLRTTEGFIALSVVAAILYIVFELLLSTRATEHERRLHAAADAANLAKSRFIANISHEVRTPLNGVMGMVQALEETPLDKDQRALVSTITDGSKTLLSLLDKLLDASKLEAGRLELDPQPFDLERMFSQLARVYGASARAKGVTFETQLDWDRQTWVEADQLRLQQILGNLLANAIKFTEQGCIALCARLEDIEGQESDAGQAILHVSISDTGIGMSELELKRIFEPFSQADASTTRRFGGTGLGLSIARDLCRLAGGHLSAESVVGQGSTFELTFPVKRLAPSQDRPARLQVANKPGADGQSTGSRPDLPVKAQRLLIVDDSRTNRLVLRRLLSGAYFEIDEASGGAEGLDLMCSHFYDAALVDVQMPEMDGVELTRLLRLDCGSVVPCDMPIIAVTANVMPDQVQTYLEAGMDAVVAKPVNKQRLLETLDDLLARKRVA